MEIRGTGIRSLLLAVEQRHGADAVERIKNALGADIRAAIEPVVVASRFYPVEVSAALQVAVRDTIGHGKWDASHDLGCAAARIDFGGVYRVFIRAMTDNAIWSSMERAWLRYNSAGEADWYERKKGFARGRVTGVRGFNQGIWNSVAGRAEELLRMSGAKTARVATTHTTSTSAEFEAKWS